MLEHIRVLKPATLVVENVPGFEGSIAHARLRHALDNHVITELELCPTQRGIPVERRRFFLLATPSEPNVPPPAPPMRSLADYLQDTPPAHTWLDDDFLARFGDALHVIEPDGVAVCFTGAYGKSPVYAGSYLRDRGRLRRFSPREIARLHGFHDDFVLPEHPRRAYKLLGNGLSVDTVRDVLSRVAPR